jgi:hypothetical protein
MMSDEFEYSNGADGCCQECGEATDEEWHAYCSDCFAAQQGWRRPDRDAIETQHETREAVSLLALLERVAELERRVADLVDLAARLSQRLDRIDFDGPISARRGPAGVR